MYFNDCILHVLNCINRVKLCRHSSAKLCLLQPNNLNCSILLDLLALLLRYTFDRGYSRFLGFLLLFCYF